MTNTDVEVGGVYYRRTSNENSFLCKGCIAYESVNPMLCGKINIKLRCQSADDREFFIFKEVIDEHSC